MLSSKATSEYSTLFDYRHAANNRFNMSGSLHRLIEFAKAEHQQLLSPPGGPRVTFVAAPSVLILHLAEPERPMKHQSEWLGRSLKRVELRRRKGGQLTLLISFERSNVMGGCLWQSLTTREMRVTALLLLRDRSAGCVGQRPTTSAPAARTTYVSEWPRV